jgi:hypothetical protein
MVNAHCVLLWPHTMSFPIYSTQHLKILPHYFTIIDKFSYLNVTEKNAVKYQRRLQYPCQRRRAYKSKVVTVPSEGESHGCRCGRQGRRSYEWLTDCTWH